MEMVAIKGTETVCPRFNPKTISNFFNTVHFANSCIFTGTSSSGLKVPITLEMDEILHFILCLEMSSSSV